MSDAHVISFDAALDAALDAEGNLNELFNAAVKMELGIILTLFFIATYFEKILDLVVKNHRSRTDT